MQVEKERRDYLGRWQLGKHGSNDYVLTSKQVVREVQRIIAKGLLEGDTAYEETLLIDSVGTFAERQGIEGEVIKDRHSTLLKSATGSFSLMSNFPAITHPVVVSQTIVPVLVEPEEPQKAQNSTERPIESKFWVSISRKTGFRRLHLRHACGIMPFNCYQTEDVWSLKDVKADAFCKPCSKHLEKSQDAVSSSSSSGSSSSEEDRPYIPGEPEIQDLTLDEQEVAAGETPADDDLLELYSDNVSVAGTSSSWMVS
jgi:hypothetical protein